MPRYAVVSREHRGQKKWQRCSGYGFAAAKRKRRRDGGTATLKTERGCPHTFTIVRSTRAEAARLSWRHIEHRR